MDRLFCLDPLLRVADVKAERAFMVTVTALVPKTSTISPALLYVVNPKDVVGLVLGGLLRRE